MRVFAYLVPFALLAGCGGGDPTGDTASASAAVDSTSSTATESAVMVAATDGTETSSSTMQAASNAATQAKVQWVPSSCVTATQQTNVVTYVLDDCTGPYGLVHVSGTVVVTYTVDSAGVHAHAVANGLSVNGATLDLDSQALYTVSSGQKTLTVTTVGSGVGALGNSIARNGSYTLSWNTSCARLDGSWSTVIGGNTWSTSVAGYAQCNDHCPTAGTLTHTGGLSRVTVTVTFDGSATAQWSTSRGRSGTIALLCTP